jgi:hypothetical protein
MRGALRSKRGVTETAQRLGLHRFFTPTGGRSTRRTLPTDAMRMLKTGAPEGAHDLASPHPRRA